MARTPLGARTRFTPLLDVFARRLCLTPLLLLAACELLPRPGDTQGEQHQALWTSAGKLVVDTDPRFTIVRIRVDSVPGRNDVLLAKFGFGNADDGSAYDLSLGLDFGDTRKLSLGKPYSVGGARAEIPAFGTIACLCHPLRPDSVRGTYELERLGIAQITGHIDVTLFFTAWDNPKIHATYRLKQRIEGVK